MLHFVTSYRKQNKTRKQNLETAQYGLEISFKLFTFAEMLQRGRVVRVHNSKPGDRWFKSRSDHSTGVVSWQTLS